MVTNPQAYKKLTWTFFYKISVHSDMAPVQFQLQQMVWFCTPPSILEVPNAPCQSPTERLCTVNISSPKKNVFKCWYISKRCCFLRGVLSCSKPQFNIFNIQKISVTLDLNTPVALAEFISIIPYHSQIYTLAPKSSLSACFQHDISIESLAPRSWIKLQTLTLGR